MDQPEVISALYWLGWLEFIKRVGGFMVIAGVAIEVGGDWISGPFHKKVEDARQLELTQLNNETARLTKESTDARAAIAGANERAAEATKKAQEASLELAKFKAPRALTQEQRGRIADKLKQFSGTEYDIAISENDPEILDFVSLVEIVLSTAEWTELDWKGTGEGLIRGRGKPIIRLGASVKNVVIGVNENQPRKLMESAQALSDALMVEDIEATAGWHTPHEMSSTNPNAIHILIGRKR
jgi:hypothetical protein